MYYFGNRIIDSLDLHLRLCCCWLHRLGGRLLLLHVPIFVGRHRVLLCAELHLLTFYQVAQNVLDLFLVSVRGVGKNRDERESVMRTRLYEIYQNATKRTSLNKVERENKRLPENGPLAPTQVTNSPKHPRHEQNGRRERSVRVCLGHAEKARVPLWLSLSCFWCIAGLSFDSDLWPAQAAARCRSMEFVGSYQSSVWSVRYRLIIRKQRGKGQLVRMVQRTSFACHLA